MNPVNPHESAVTVVSLDANTERAKKAANATTCSKLCTYACISLLFILCIGAVLSFVIVDLYFAYNSNSCQSISNTGVGFTLGAWLQVDGYCMLVSVVISLLVSKTPLKFATETVFRLFFLAWTIVGAVMFWHYLGPSGACGKSLSDYMWARLIIGLFGAAASCCDMGKDRADHNVKW